MRWGSGKVKARCKINHADLSTCLPPALPSSSSLLSSHIRRSSPGWRGHHAFFPQSSGKGETEARSDDALSCRVLPTGTSRHDIIRGTEVTSPAGLSASPRRLLALFYV